MTETTKQNQIGTPTPSRARDLKPKFNYLVQSHTKVSIYLQDTSLPFSLPLPGRPIPSPLCYVCNCPLDIRGTERARPRKRMVKLGVGREGGRPQLHRRTQYKGQAANTRVVWTDDGRFLPQLSFHSWSDFPEHLDIRIIHAFSLIIQRDFLPFESNYNSWGWDKARPLIGGKIVG